MPKRIGRYDDGGLEGGEWEARGRGRERIVLSTDIGFCEEKQIVVVDHTIHGRTGIGAWDTKGLTRPTRNVRMNSDRHTESIWVLSITVLKVCLPLLLYTSDIDESMRVLGVLDEH
jgi:hypothetical protein